MAKNTTIPVISFLYCVWLMTIAWRAAQLRVHVQEINKHQQLES
jgi:hypothetical protein